MHTYLILGVILQHSKFDFFLKPTNLRIREKGEEIGFEDNSCQKFVSSLIAQFLAPDSGRTRLESKNRPRSQTNKLEAKSGNTTCASIFINNLPTLSIVSHPWSQPTRVENFFLFQSVHSLVEPGEAL